VRTSACALSNCRIEQSKHQGEAGQALAGRWAGKWAGARTNCVDNRMHSTPALPTHQQHKTCRQSPRAAGNLLSRDTKQVTDLQLPVSARATHLTACTHSTWPPPTACSRAVSWSCVMSASVHIAQLNASRFVDKQHVTHMPLTKKTREKHTRDASCMLERT